MRLASIVLVELIRHMMYNMLNCDFDIYISYLRYFSGNNDYQES